MPFFRWNETATTASPRSCGRRHTVVTRVAGVGMALVASLAIASSAFAASGTVGYHATSNVNCFDGGMISVYSPTIYAANVTTKVDSQKVGWRSNLWQWLRPAGSTTYAWVLVAQNPLIAYVQDDSGSSIAVDSPYGAQSFQLKAGVTGYFRVSIDFYWYATTKAAAGSDSLWANHNDEEYGVLLPASYCTYHA